MTEILNPVTNVYGKNCIGCQRHGKDIMLTFVDCNENGGVTGEIYDIFVSEAQAMGLMENILDVIQRNEKED